MYSYRSHNFYCDTCKVRLERHPHGGVCYELYKHEKGLDYSDTMESEGEFCSLTCLLEWVMRLTG